VVELAPFQPLLAEKWMETGDGAEAAAASPRNTFSFCKDTHGKVIRLLLLDRRALQMSL